MRPVHLRNGDSYTGIECRQSWDNVTFPDGPDPMTRELSEVTCKACRAWMVKEGNCPECGGFRLIWDSSPVNLSSAMHGRLFTGDVETQFHLGCEECSETLIHSVSPDQVAQFLTQKKYRP